MNEQNDGFSAFPLNSKHNACGAMTLAVLPGSEQVNGATVESSLHIANTGNVLTTVLTSRPLELLQQRINVPSQGKQSSRETQLINYPL